MNSIEKTTGNVDPIRLPEINNSEAIAESIQTQGASASGFIKSPSKQLKEEISFAALVALDGHKLQKKGQRLVCLCPFHEERTPSFFISEDDITGKCYGCDWYGDVFDYEMKAHKVGFARALARLQEKKNKVLRTTPINLCDRARKPATELKLTKEQQEIMDQAARRLMEDELLCARVAEKRGWKPETIQRLARQESLGWYRGALAFLYPTGMKVRNWPHKVFEWEFGGQFIWRVDRIAKARHIYVTEGESDTISLLDTGIEEDCTCAVVCVPGASAFQKQWAPIFEGKTVTLCFDNDGAGDRAAQIIAGYLEPYAAQIRTVNYGEVLHE